MINMAQIAERVWKIRSLMPQAMLRDQAAINRSLNILLQKSSRSFKGDSRSADHRTGPDLAKKKRLLDELSSLENRVEESIRERNSRLRRMPTVHFPSALPITSKRNEIVRAIKENPVLIISGETGCGKSTQIPKMCLEAGRGIAGKIACTQPRRIAAITIAHRIAEEMGETIGRSVGYKIRFQDKTSPEAYIKIMTDGMLLAETQSDRGLYEYDTFIIDEAHERSLNIDFLLGIARTFLDARPELKIIITSATLDTEKFSKAFNDAPVIHVGGRMYPVEVEYMPPDTFSKDADEADYIDLAVQAVDRLKSGKQRGDILVFMPTEQDILETRERLEGKKYTATTILPLYARLPASEQGRVYSVGGSKIIVATNVAETSLTIPGIRFVIDTGLARIAQYQPGTRINSLPVSPISQASADQRKGRCGRVQEGLCIRLYSEEDYESRLPFTPPEILRSNLAEVILRMLFLGLGHPAEFPFVDRPHPKNIKDGYETLSELGATAGKGREYELTPLGRQMALMPLDPKISRMLLEARQEGCLREVAIIASALSIRDPRERPPDKAGLADQAQASFAHPDSDFLTFLNLWDRYHSAAANLTSQSKRKKFCHEHFLSFARMREWAFVHDQIISILKEQQIPLGREDKAELSIPLYAAIHRSILSGFLSNIAVHKEKNIYNAAKSREAMVFPGSTLFNKSRPWIVAAEMVRTSRLFARTAAKIDPAWLEELGGDECRYSYSEPRWDKGRGEVRAKERVTLYGLEIVSGRDVPYGPKNPEEAQEIFVRDGLVEGRVNDPPAFLQHNLSLKKKLSDMEEKLRRRNIMVNEDVMADFYSQRLAGIFDVRGLEKRIRHMGTDDFLRMSEKNLLLSRPDKAEMALYPDELAVGGRIFEASYRFAPGEDDDGVTLKIPPDQVESIPAAALEWGVPGYFREKIAALIKGLPKRYRKLLMPVSDTADIIVKEITQTEVSLFEALAKYVDKRFHVNIPAAEWANADIPKHLKTRVAVADYRGGTLLAGRDLDELRQEASSSYGPADSVEWKNAKEKWEREGLTSWDLGSLPETIPVGPFVAAYPALEPGDTGVNLRLFKNLDEAISSHQRGVESLLLLQFAKDLEFMRRYLVLPEEYEKTALYFGGRSAVEKSMLDHLRQEVFRRNFRTKEEFEACAGIVVRELYEKGHTLQDTILFVLEAYQKTRRILQAVEASSRSNRAIAVICEQIRRDMQTLVPKNFLEIYSLERLRHLSRYLNALGVRAERAKHDPEKDRKKAGQAAPFLEAHRRMEEDIRLETSLEKKKAIAEFRWMVEEFKVSLFAPELKTALPVSIKRLALKLQDINKMA
jgi:ATP-dependent helicase HrpA